MGRNVNVRYVMQRQRRIKRSIRKAGSFRYYSGVDHSQALTAQAGRSAQIAKAGACRVVKSHGGAQPLLQFLGSGSTTRDERHAKDKVGLSPAELALAESWFAVGRNPEINRILATKAKKYRHAPGR